MLADVTGDGLDDLIVSSLSQPGSDWKNSWSVTANAGVVPMFKSSGGGIGFSLDQFQAVDFDPNDPQPWWGVPFDVDMDGRKDFLLDPPNLRLPTWRVMHARADHTFELLDTGIARHVLPAAKVQRPEYAGALLADVNGDGAADLIQCYDSGYEDSSPDQARWTVNLGVPTAAGFSPTAEPIPPLDGRTCLLADLAGRRFIKLADLDADGKVDLLVPQNGAYEYPQDPAACGGKCTYSALSYVAPGQWSSVPTKLPVPRRGNTTQTRGTVVFPDVNGDGLPDAVMSGFDDARPRTFMNTGRGFAAPAQSLPGPLPGKLGWDHYLDLAQPLDFNGDGSMDLLMPMHHQCGDGSEPGACWVVLQADYKGEGAFTIVKLDIALNVDPDAPLYEAAPFRTRAVQVTDVNGDGRPDLVLPENGHFSIYRNDGPQDLLVSVTDGMNALDATDTGFLPNVSITYGSLVDLASTFGIPEGSPDRENLTYLARSGTGNDCVYPRACVVGPRRVVSKYALNNGANQPRTFAVKYRDGRYHHQGRGFLGFEMRIVVDTDTEAGSAELFDNVTYDPGFAAFPFAGQVVRSWAWAPGLSTQPDPDRIELTYTRRTLQTVSTNEGKTYFTLPVGTRVTRKEGSHSASSGGTVFEYVGASEVGGAAVLSDSWSLVSDFDEYGNVLARADSHAGVDLETTVARTYANDPATWLVGRMTSEQVCSTALGMTQCRGMELHHDSFGEVWSASIGDPGDPETHLSLVYAHDVYGNLIFGAADDAFGHHRSACTSYDAEGIFPYAMGNAAGHIAYAKFDPGLGVRTAAVDANGLVTQWNHDGFGRVSGEFRPDGTSTEVWLTRVKDGGPQGNWWNVKADTFSDGGGESIAEIDMLGRAVRTYVQGPDVTACDGSACTGLPWFVEEVGFDDLGRVARVSVPRLASSTAAPVYHAFEYDAVGRVVKRTTPWGSKTKIAYEQHLTLTSDSAGTSSVLVDALGRTVEVTDKAGSLTQYTHGPFGGLVRVDGPGGEVTSMTRDAYGRVRQQSDPNRGESTTEYDGFGEATHTLDALGRAYAFTYDGLGRLIERDDPDGITSWKYDTAAHGKGMLAVVTSPAGHAKSFTYDGLSRPETVSLALDTETFQSAMTYDAQGRLATIAYPPGDGVAPLTVAREYDGGGFLVGVRDAGTNASLWKLNTVDGAGRTALETFGNGVTTRHEYDGKKGAVTRILTNVPSFGLVGPPPIQDLRYTYDSRLNVASRQDWLQVSTAGVATERFDYDALDRLTCAWFTTTPIGSGLVYQPGGAAVACTPHVEYHANGNIKLKSDVGTYAYDPLHPHAVLTAGSATYAHDAVGNQIQRPDGTVAYTAFDLPATLTRAADGASVIFDYDGDQQRIRKTTPDEETVTFGGLYERVTAAGSVKHRYYVAVGGATLAITRAAGAADEVAYIHPDALGSVDVVTDGAGKLAEKRSYDAFGARRNPQWGKPPAAAQASNVNMGFTGHEPDELGLVNMKGRIYDPKLGRFLMTDPLVSRPFFSQGWNAYSYVLNNPLKYVDPSGFDGAPAQGSVTGGTAAGVSDAQPYATLPYDLVTASPGFVIAANISFSSYPADQPSAAPPENGPTDGASESALSKAGNLGLGVAQGAVDWTIEGTKFVYLSALTFGGYGTYKIYSGVWEGYKKDGGVLGAANAVNPFYQVAKGGVDTVQAVQKGDYYTAGHAGITTAATIAVTVYGAAAGAEAADVAAAGRAAQAAEVVVSLAERAEQIHGALNSIAQQMRTTAVLETTGGRIVAGGGPDLTPAQRAALGPGETAARLPKAHAEVTALTHAAQAGTLPVAIAATRIICPACAAAIEASGGKLINSKGAVWPR
jgi:RHS repeat-associated protein